MSFTDTIIKRASRDLRRATESMAAEDVIDAFFLPVDRMESDFRNNGEDFVSFGHYDYLGISHHERLVNASVNAVRKYGTGAGASRLVGGEREAHRAFERELAKFLGVEDVLAVISGYLTNLSLIPHLLTSKDLLIIDNLAHNSISSATRSGRLSHRSFKHNDCVDLERLLIAERENYRNVLIVTEGLFSMDGDIPDLPKLIELKNKHNAWLMLDEAHSYGVLGETGRGITEYFGVDPKEIDISVGTLSKSFCASGGFIAAQETVISWLRYTLPGFVFSVGLSPMTVASAHAALDLLKCEPKRLSRLRQNSAIFRTKANAAGLNTGVAMGMAVVPIMFQSAQQTLDVSKALRTAGIYAPPVAQVGVPTDMPRIRFFMRADHTEAQMDKAIETVVQALAG